MPNYFLQYSAYVSRDPYVALKAFWEMPLGILWQLIHCELIRNGVDVRFSLCRDDDIGMIRDLKNVPS